MASTITMLSIMLFLVAGTAAAVPGLPIPKFTITGGYYRNATEVCTTSFGSVAQKPLPTHSHNISLLPNIAIVLTTSTPIQTITPPPQTTTETTNTIEETTTTLSAVVDTFTSTSTEISTTTETKTIIVEETRYYHRYTTSTTTSRVPAPTSFKPVAETFNLTNFTEPGGLEYAKLVDQSAKLELRDKLENQDPAQEWGLPDIPGLKPPKSSYPTLVDCDNYIEPGWTKSLVFVHKTSTTTLLPSTSTTTITDTITSTSTLIPRASTTSTTYSTVWTTDTAATTTTSFVFDTVTTTSYAEATHYAQCDPDNIIGPHLSNGRWLDILGKSPPGSTLRPVQAESMVQNALECCVACATTKNCVSNQYISLPNGGKFCLVFSTPDSCPKAHFENLYSDVNPPSMMSIVSNGACGFVGVLEEARPQP